MLRDEAQPLTLGDAELPREASMRPNLAPHFLTFFSKVRRLEGHETP